MSINWRLAFEQEEKNDTEKASHVLKQLKLEVISEVFLKQEYDAFVATSAFSKISEFLLFGNTFNTLFGDLNTNPQTQTRSYEAPTEVLSNFRNLIGRRSQAEIDFFLIVHGDTLMQKQIDHEVIANTLLSTAPELLTYSPTYISDIQGFVRDQIEKSLACGLRFQSTFQDIPQGAREYSAVQAISKTWAEKDHTMHKLLIPRMVYLLFFQEYIAKLSLETLSKFIHTRLQHLKIW